MSDESGPQIRILRFGDWEIAGFLERRFALDGGGMFGVVPRIMWQKLLTPDSENRVPMQANLFLIRTGNANILLDTGLGDALSERDIKVYDPRGPSYIDDSLRLLGVAPESITHVVFTHLHTDHSNGACVGDPDHPRLRFHNARWVVQRDEWEDATHPDERTSSVYIVHRLKLFEEGGRLQLLDGDSEIVPGVRVVKTGGHTRGHQAVIVEHGGLRFLYYGDIIPSRFHLKGPYVAAVDLFPLDTMRVKKGLLSEATKENTIVGFDHDIGYIFGRLVQKEKWVEVVPIETSSVSTT